MSIRDFVSDPDLKAPYWRFRPTDFYNDVFAGGTYTADIQFCTWTCEGCWSQYGWMGYDPRHVLTPDKVAAKLIKGMTRNAQAMSRISGGEATIFYEHMKAVIGLVLEETDGESMVVPDVTDNKGDPMGIVVETNGALLSIEQLDELDQLWGEMGKRFVLAFGMKSTSPEGLARLTGMAPAAAQSAHERQLRNFLHASLKCENLVVYSGWIEELTDPAVYARLQRTVERAKPGCGRHFSLFPIKSYVRSKKPAFVPKRFREEWGVPEDDEETAMSLLGPDGQVVEDPSRQRSEKELAGVEKAKKAMADLPPGKVKKGD